MTPNEYQRAALRTEYTPVYVHDHTDKPSLLLSRLDHAAKGMCTEIGELKDMLKKHIVYGKPFDEVNVLEECGDQLWYLALAAAALDLPMAGLMPHPKGWWTEEFDGSASHIKNDLRMSAVDFGARVIFISAAAFDQELGLVISGGWTFELWAQKAPNDAGGRLRAQIEGVALVLRACGYTLEQAMERNIEKLRKRYPEKFTAEAALNRDLDGERAVLEGTK